jgi:hypothetical protein
VRTKSVYALLTVLAFAAPASGHGKGFTRVVLVGSDGRSVEARAKESTIDALLSRRGRIEQPVGGHLRLFFVGARDFPANPGRYYPETPCVALDWPAYEKSCRRIRPALVRLLRPAQALTRFDVRPTVLSHVQYLGRSRPRAVAALLKTPVELALGRVGRAAPRPRGCYPFTGTWRGPAAADRPRRFLVCRGGVYAGNRLHPLGRGVWNWLRLNAGPTGPT